MTSPTPAPKAPDDLLADVVYDDAGLPVAATTPLYVLDEWIAREDARNREAGLKKGQNDPRHRLDLRDLRARVAELEERLAAAEKRLAAITLPDERRDRRAYSDALQRKRVAEFTTRSLNGEIGRAQLRVERL
jgi:hypothetical protein